MGQAGVELELEAEGGGCDQRMGPTSKKVNVSKGKLAIVPLTTTSVLTEAVTSLQ